MKKLISLFLATVMVLSLAACGEKTEEPTTVDTPPEVVEEAFKPDYKTLNVMVPFKAGGTVDLYARLVAKYAPQYTDINLVITNMEGSSGMVGAMEVLGHEADGTWMMATAPSTSWVSTADRQLPYTMEDDWVAVAALYNYGQVLLTRADNENFDDFDSYIEYCKANPGKVNVGLSGASGNPYYYTVMTNEKYGIENTPVAFDGESEAMTNLLGGHVEAIVCSTGTAVTQINNGEAKALLIFAGAPCAQIPGVKTMADYGYEEMIGGNRGFTMKKGTDQKILNYWSDILAQICANPDFIAESEALGFEILFYDTESATQLYYDTVKSIEKVMSLYS